MGAASSAKKPSGNESSTECRESPTDTLLSSWMLDLSCKLGVHTTESTYLQSRPIRSPRCISQPRNDAAFLMDIHGASLVPLCHVCQEIKGPRKLCPRKSAPPGQARSPTTHYQRSNVIENSGTEPLRNCPLPHLLERRNRRSCRSLCCFYLCSYRNSQAG